MYLYGGKKCHQNRIVLFYKDRRYSITQSIRMSLCLSVCMSSSLGILTFMIPPSSGLIKLIFRIQKTGIRMSRKM